MSRARRLLYSLLVTAFVLAAVELTLRATGALDDQQLISPLFFQQPAASNDILPIEDGWVRWTSGTAHTPSPAGYRAIVLGASAVQGDGVTPFAAFAGQLQRKLLRAEPEAPVEVMNLGMGGIGSRQVAHQLEQGLAALHPQLAIVYSGNNEFHELRALAHSSAVYRANLERTRRRLHALHLYRALQHLLGLDQLQPLDQLPADLPEVYQIPVLVNADDRALAALLYRQNLQRMVRSARVAGVPLLLCTVADNRADWVDGLPGRTLSDEELGLVAEVEGAAERRDRALATRLAERAWPELNDERAFYRIGWALLGLGLRDQARRYLDQAELVMARPNRSSSELRAVVREVAQQPGVHLCDVHEAMDEHSRLGVAGDEFFSDACHPNPQGHNLIASTLATCAQQAGLLPPHTKPGSWGRPLSTDPLRVDHDQRWMNTVRDGDPDPGTTAQGAARNGHDAFAQRDHDAAFGHYADALGLGGDSAALLTSQALVRWHQGRMSDVEALLSEAAVLAANDPEIGNWKALLTR